MIYGNLLYGERAKELHLMHIRILSQLGNVHHIVLMMWYMIDYWYGIVYIYYVVSLLSTSSQAKLLLKQIASVFMVCRVMVMDPKTLLYGHGLKN